MEEVLVRLQKFVNEEMVNNGYTIGDFALRCGISYNEMRNIANGQAKDLRISTIGKICDNSHIEISDIFVDRIINIENMLNRLILLYNTERYSVTVAKYR